MRRSSDHEKNENNDRWLLTYADMITLLMAFFIMMYSMSVLNLSRFREAAFSIRSGFGGVVKGQGKSILGSGGTFAAKPSGIEGDTAGVSWKVIKPLVTFIEKESREHKGVEIGEDSRGIVITMLSDSLVFEPGSSEIKSQVHSVLNRISDTIKKIPNMVQIEGHTCNLPTRNAAYPSNWELSTARATNVLRYLVEETGLDSWRFSAAGYGSVRPIFPNNSDKNRTKNRRVEIIILRPELSANMPAVQPRRLADPTGTSIRRRQN